MADAETCELSASHPPKPAATKSFTALLPEIKHQLIHLRHDHDKHEPEYFQDVAALSDVDLTAFDSDDIVAVRAGKVAYGVLIFGKVRLGKSNGGYIFVRWFVGGDDLDGDGVVEASEGEVEYKFHSFYTEDRHDAKPGERKYRAIMGEADELFFFSE
ncbi:hypothetical protein NA57DRAFT_78115 [Rhizodiscina lignyota]|uniref:Uncharacterized protein n=1 Tax=Rhizodiscina lignyota TaxID=1504668 RepID=A0A9P4IDF3_9PEZI|nr:hypothetical protein NA57DRAFT_78115 [Rhizodiscina lignyota]